MTDGFSQDIALLKNRLAALPTYWEGKQCVLALKEANYNWRQMEWWAFYFEFTVFSLVKDSFQIPGDRFGNVRFDLKRSVNWDIKSKAIKSDEHNAILNDKEAMERSLALYGEHGAIIGLCDVEYNDENRTFQQWHTELKGGKSKYEKKREARTSISRYRKTCAVLVEILFLRFTPDSLPYLGTMKQGRNSNDRPRREKYMIDLEQVDSYLVDRIVFPQISTR